MRRSFEGGAYSGAYSSKFGKHTHMHAQTKNGMRVWIWFLTFLAPEYRITGASLSSTDLKFLKLPHCTSPPLKDTMRRSKPVHGLSEMRFFPVKTTLGIHNKIQINSCLIMTNRTSWRGPRLAMKDSALLGIISQILVSVRVSWLV